MSGLQTFDPDSLYCVHCHAEAAGMCARCGAMCCGDCVELRPGLTRRQAICRVCLGAGGESRRGSWRFAAGAVALVVAAVVVWRWLVA